MIGRRWLCSAASKNLNVGMVRFERAADMYKELRSMTAAGGDYTVRHFVGVIEKMSVEDAVVETELFPRGALEYYTKKNLGFGPSNSEWQDPERGGEQGDYSDGMREKIDNVVECLRVEPRSKRAVIPIPFSSVGSKHVDWTNQGQSKCVRELYFYVEEGKLCCTGVLRMQNASIFPKNVHFFAAVMDEVAGRLGLEVGEYTHFIMHLCHDRSAISC